MRFSVLTVGVMLALSATDGFAQGTASGTLTIGKDKFEMKYSAAILVPDSFDKTKTKTRIVLADKPIPEDVLDNEGQLWDLKSKGFHALEFEVNATKTNYSLMVISATIDGSFSSSGTFDGSKITVFTPQRVEGALIAAPETHFGTTVGYSLKFATNVTAREAAPTAADTAAAAGKESTKSYLALVQAIRAGDKQKIIELSPPDRRATIDTPKFPEMLKMVQMMTPKDIQVLKATETGDSAKLVARGMEGGKAKRGRISMNRVNGKWILINESWGPE